MTDAAVVAEGLGKSFGRVTALDGVDLEVPAGSAGAARPERRGEDNAGADPGNPAQA
jgi:hypothetical protein